MTSLGPFFLSLDINIPGLNIPVTVSVQGTAVGAVFHVAPESLDWSRQLVLVPVKKELVLTNEVIIPAAFTCTLHPVVSGFICEVCLGLFARYVSLTSLTVTSLLHELQRHYYFSKTEPCLLKPI